MTSKGKARAKDALREYSGTSVDMGIALKAVKKEVDALVENLRKGKGGPNANGASLALLPGNEAQGGARDHWGGSLSALVTSSPLYITFSTVPENRRRPVSQPPGENACRPALACGAIRRGMERCLCAGLYLDDTFLPEGPPHRARPVSRRSDTRGSFRDPCSKLLYLPSLFSLLLYFGSHVAAFRAPSPSSCTFLHRHVFVRICSLNHLCLLLNPSPLFPLSPVALSLSCLSSRRTRSAR